MIHSYRDVQVDMCEDEQHPAGELEAATIQILQKAKRHPVLSKKLQREIARSVESYRQGRELPILDRLIAEGSVIAFGFGKDAEYYWAENIDQLKERLCTIVGSHHRQFPYESGIRAGDIKKKFSDTSTMNARRNVDPRLFDLAMLESRRDGLVIEADKGVRLAGFRPLSNDDEGIQKLEGAIIECFVQNMHSRTSIEEMCVQLNENARKVKAVVSGLLQSGRLIRIRDDRFLELSVVEEIKRVLAKELHRKSQLRIADITVLLGLSRSSAIPLLEYFDRIGFTQRTGDYRMLADV